MTSSPLEKPISMQAYFIRAVHQWCLDNRFSPYIKVFLDSSVKVPLTFLNHQEIVFNINTDAVADLDLGNETIRFKARFSGLAHEILIPVHRVAAIYAQENGQGIVFDLPQPEEIPDTQSEQVIRQEEASPYPVDVSGEIKSSQASLGDRIPKKPTLTRIK